MKRFTAKGTGAKDQREEKIIEEKRKKGVQDYIFY